MSTHITKVIPIANSDKAAFQLPHLIKVDTGKDESGRPVRIEHLMPYELLLSATERSNDLINGVIRKCLGDFVTEGSQQNGLLHKLSTGKLKAHDVMTFGSFLMPDEDSDMNPYTDDDLRILTLFFSENKARKIAIQLHDAYAPYRIFGYKGLIQVLALHAWVREPEIPIGVHQKRKMKNLAILLAKKTGVAPAMLNLFERKGHSGKSGDEDIDIVAAAKAYLGSDDDDV